MMSKLPDENFKTKLFVFSRYCPLQILALKTCNQENSKTKIARSFKLGELIEKMGRYPGKNSKK